MLTTKKWAADWRQFSPGVLVAIVLAAGCTPPGPRALLEGESLLQRGQYAKAVERLKAAVDLLPQNPQAWNHYGLALHGAGRPEEAARAYRQALAPGRNLPVAHFNLGCLLLEQRDYAGASEELRAFTVLQPQNAAAWFKLGTAQLRLRQFDVAEKSFRQALALDAKDAEALTSLGLAQVYRGKPADAAVFFGAALQARPGYPPALFNLAVVSHFYLPHRTVDRRPFALEKYREYLALRPPPPHRAPVEQLARQLETELNPPKPSVTNTVSQSSAATNVTAAAPAGKPDPAKIAVVLSATKPGTASSLISGSNSAPVVVKNAASPDISTAAPPATNPPPLVTNFARLEPSAMAGAGKAGSATPPKAELSKETKAEPSGFLERINPANLFKRAPKPDVLFNSATNPAADVSASVSAAPPAPASSAPVGGAARRYAYLAPAAPTGGSHAAALPPFEQGLRAHRQGKLADAVTAYQGALKQHPAFFEANYNLGLALQEVGDVPAALAALETALAVDAKSADARYSFAQALRKGGYHVDAMTELERLIAEHPAEARAHLALANLYVEQMSLRALAREHYLKVLELEPRHPQATDIRFWLRANQ